MFYNNLRGINLLLGMLKNMFFLHIDGSEEEKRRYKMLNL